MATGSILGMIRNPTHVVFPPSATRDEPAPRGSS